MRTWDSVLVIFCGDTCHLCITTSHLCDLTHHQQSVRVRQSLERLDMIGKMRHFLVLVFIKTMFFGFGLVSSHKLKIWQYWGEIIRAHGLSLRLLTMTSLTHLLQLGQRQFRCPEYWRCLQIANYVSTRIKCLKNMNSKRIYEREIYVYLIYARTYFQANSILLWFRLDYRRRVCKHDFFNGT